MNPVIHAKSTARKFGGAWQDYLAVHEWFDETKMFIADARHRILRHHAFGIFECMAKFGPVIVNSKGQEIPTRLIGEQHVREDCGGMIPSLEQWVANLKLEKWMNHTYPENGVFDPANPRHRNKALKRLTKQGE